MGMHFPLYRDCIFYTSTLHSIHLSSYASQQFPVCLNSSLVTLSLVTLSQPPNATEQSFPQSSQSMAIPFSIKETIDICKSIFKLYKSYKHVPIKMQNAVRDVRYYAEVLKAVKASAQQLSYLETAKGKGLKRELQKKNLYLRKNLKRFKRLVKQWGRGRSRWARRFWFMFHTIDRVSDLQNVLSTCMKRVCHLLDLADHAEPKINASQLGALIVTFLQQDRPCRASPEERRLTRKTLKELLKELSINGKKMTLEQFKDLVARIQELKPAKSSAKKKHRKSKTASRA